GFGRGELRAVFATILTDKTGTLTKAEMTLETIYASRAFHAVSGVGYAPEGDVHDLDVVRELLRVATLCSDARLVPPTPPDTWRIVGDTTEGAILVAAAKGGIDRGAEEERTPRVGVFPFDPDRRIMTTLHRDGRQVRAYVKGSPEAVTQRCTHVRIDAQDLPFDDVARRDVATADDAMASSGLRVLAVAIKQEASDHASQSETENGLTLLGLVGIFDPPRPEVAAAVSACRDAGIQIYMVTGDYGLTAEALARRVGIIDEGPVRIVTGEQLENTDPEGLTSILTSEEQIVFARVRPEHKMRIVDALESMGEIVAVTGDGANDAPALKRASVGIAMGDGGTDVARSAAVMVLLDDSFASIVAAIQLGRAVYQNIRRFLIYVFTSNIGELAPILVATFVGFPLVPLSALQVLAIDLGTDVLPALALGAERPERDTMSRPPRPPSERLFSWAVVRRILFLGTLQSIGVIFVFFWKIHGAHLGFGDFTTANPTYRQALTMTQASIVVSQFFISFAVRSERASLRRTGLFTNLAVLGAGLLSLSFIAAVSYVPLLQGIFHTAPLAATDWLIIVAFGVLLLVVDESRKAWHRRRDASQLLPGGESARTVGGPATPRRARRA
ncbi:MAG: cation-transporting P-type ATPase, partial [Acidobacteria bacterium]|nr:cation-transporting P-type ATPase [Acidobacteriota bacterium]